MCAFFPLHILIIQLLLFLLRSLLHAFTSGAVLITNHGLGFVFFLIKYTFRSYSLLGISIFFLAF